MAERQCKRCQAWYDERFFRLSKSTHTRMRTWRMSICKGCEQSCRDTETRRNRPRRKAYAAIRSHARRLIETGVIRHKDELVKEYGWDVDRMTHDIEFQYQNGCAYCNESFSEMGNGYSDITLDIVNPEELPFYITNVKWVCATCNKQKQRTKPKDWAIVRRCWTKWTNLSKARQIDPYAGLPLLEGLSE